MPIVTLTTDLGFRDFNLGALKGNILHFAPALNIVDITHNIQQFSVVEAAFVLKNAFNNFPKGTAHLITVNDMDERTIKLIAAKYEDHYFITFDNGCLSLIFEHAPEEIVALKLPGENGVKQQPTTKQLLASAAAKISMGTSLSELGEAIKSITSRINLSPVVQDNLIRGQIIFVDAFSNLIVNITQDLFSEARNGRDFAVSFRRDKIKKISDNYHDVPQGEKLCIFNSSGYLKIAINSGKASSLLGLAVGDQIQIDFQ